MKVDFAIRTCKNSTAEGRMFSVGTCLDAHESGFYTLKKADTLESSSDLRPIGYPLPHLGKFRKLLRNLFEAVLTNKIWSNFDFRIHILTVDSSAFGCVGTLMARFLIFGHAEFNETIISQISYLDAQNSKITRANQ
ncbi:hypothetical protein RCL_jg13096.t1 [Rhizophagus clarus]|uniref:Uncharacterized protein n=1 Tax=Rhizophagus clarus TaxID=94130 RepID=A0A8H3KW45_9GLOM|nr:hypothetical protein RCL_jg13096.t1 [Rhizophagus clarus]